MKKIIINILNNSFIKGGFFLTVSNFIVGLINYVFNVLTGRALGPEGYGEVATLFSYLTVVSIPVGIVGMLIVQKIGNSKNPEIYTVALFEWLKLKLKKYWYISLLSLIILPFIPKLTNLKIETANTLYILVILSLIGAFYHSALTALHLFSSQSLFNILGATVKLSGALIAFWGFGSLRIILLMLIFSSIFQLILKFIFISKKLKEQIGQTFDKIEKGILDIFKDRQLWYTSSATAVLTLLGNIDIIFVKRFFSAEDAGIFGAWSVFAKIILYVIGPLISLSFIFFSSRKNQEWHKPVFMMLLLFFIFSGVVANLGYGFFGREIIEMLFGKKFLPLLPYMEWAGLFGIGYVLMLFMMQYYLAKKSKITLIPAILFPIYLGFLFFYSKTLADVMLIDTLYTFIVTAIFLIIFFQERLHFFINLFKK